MKKLIILFATVVAFISCSENNEASKIVVDPGFRSYVNAFTSGVISCKSNIKVVLIQPYTNAKAGEAVDLELFEFEPKIEGHAFWIDNQTIEFRPNEILPSGQHFVAKFNLNKLLEVPEKYQQLEFGFVIISQNLYVSFDGLQTTNENFTEQEIFGTLRTNDYADPVFLQECLQAKQNGKELDISWEHVEGTKVHTYTIKGVKRGEQKSTVKLEWDGEPIGVDVDDQMEIVVPSITEFSVMQIRAVQSPGLYFSIQFSDPVKVNQDLSGLITLKSGKNLRFTISGNEIKAYPLSKMNSEEEIIVDNAILNVNGNRLIVAYQQVVLFNLEKPAVELIGDGVIMPSSAHLNFPFRAINLKAVNMRILKIYEHNVHQFFQVNFHNGGSELTRVGRLVYDDVIDLVSDEPLDYGVWNNYSVDLSKLIEPEPGAIYRVMISFEQYQSLYPCPDLDKDVPPLKRRELNFDEYSYFDEDSWYEGWGEWNERDNPCSPAYYKAYDKAIGANIFSSNFGIIAKEASDNNFTVTITDLRTTEPISGVAIEAHNFQGSVIGEGTTNGDGVVQFQTDGKPYLLVAKEGKQHGYLRVDNGSSLSVSLYDVGGSKITKGVKGFIYGERGVWRPGDTLFLSFMLEDKENVLPETHPIIMELYDPMGKLYEKQVKTTGVKGLYSFPFTTDKDDVTGKWQAKAIVGNSSFSKLLKIETIKPNRIKIDYDFGKIITSEQSIATTLNAKWLYGSPGANLKVNSEMNVSVIKTSFDKYDGFSFDDRSIRISYQEPIIIDTKTNSEGDAKLYFPWKKPSMAPGMLKLSFNTKVYEQGGDFSQDFYSLKYSPFETYVGVKLEKGTNWLTAIDTENESRVAIAAVDENGNPVHKKVNVELYKLHWDWWWEGDGEDDLTSYINRQSNNLLKSESFSVTDGKGFYNLTFPNAAWGRYLVRVVDPVSGHSASQIFFGKYSSWYNDEAGGDNTAASALSIETGKAEYNVGEKIQVTVPSGGIGNIYVTIEKGDKIIDQMWVKATDNSTSFTIDASAEMSPNVYINAVLIQPHGQSKNSLPIRMYGVIPVKVYDEQTRIKPVIACPNVLQPEKDFTVSVSEKTGKAMAYSLAVVDEGLLSLTRFKTPEPWDEFYKKEALSIRSWDMYQYVMSAQTGKMAALLAVGGDEGLKYKEDADANRFKPVVTYLGPFFLENGAKNKHTVHIPNYIGAVRVMVVAGYNGAYGSEEKELQVKQPLMVLSTLPRVLGPSEIIKIPVNIISMDKGIKTVQVKVTTNDLLKPVTVSEQSVSFDKEGEKTIYFDYKVARKLGVATYKVEVSSGKERAFEALEILVRPPNPEITHSESKTLEANQTWSQSYEAIGIDGSNKAHLQISSIPDLNLEKHLHYLIQYPHGCVEQTTSSVFPQLFLNSFIDLSDEKKEEIKANIIAGINRLKGFQHVSGGFGYWPGSEYVSEWGTNYAGHFLLEAKNIGYDLPSGMLEAWVKFQKGEANNWERSKYYYYGRYGGDLMQAYRLYSLALSGNSEIGAMNRLRNDPKLSDMAAWRLAAAYAIAGREDVALELTKRNRTVEAYKAMSYSFGSDVRDLAMILETLHYTKDVQSGIPIIKDIAQRLSSGWYGTQSRAYALLAIAKFIGKSDKESAFTATVEVNGKTISVGSESPVWNAEINEKFLLSGDFKVTNNSSQIIFVSFSQTGIPVELNQVPAEKDLTMNITYTDLKGNPLNIKALPQGTDFKAIVNVTHPGIRSEYKEIALSQIFPSGWQIVNTRVGDASDAETSTNFTYRDIRDDRVYTYFDLHRRENKRFEILLNATFVGKYYMPAVFCAPMYDESIQSLKPGQWVDVVKSNKE